MGDKILASLVHMSLSFKVRPYSTAEYPSFSTSIVQQYTNNHVSLEQ
jgi:hypothetical protein